MKCLLRDSAVPCSFFDIYLFKAFKDWRARMLGSQEAVRLLTP